jgi:hypothetical protein
VGTGTSPLRQFLLLADLNLWQGKPFLRKLAESEQAKMKSDERVAAQTQLSTSRALETNASSDAASDASDASDASLHGLCMVCGTSRNISSAFCNLT